MTEPSFNHSFVKLLFAKQFFLHCMDELKETGEYSINIVNCSNSLERKLIHKYGKNVARLYDKDESAFTSLLQSAETISKHLSSLEMTKLETIGRCAELMKESERSSLNEDMLDIVQNIKDSIYSDEKPEDIIKTLKSIL
jgi:hypothetical protein